MSEKELKNIVIDMNSSVHLQMLISCSKQFLSNSQKVQEIYWRLRLWELMIRRNQKHICTNLLAS